MPSRNSGNAIDQTTFVEETEFLENQPKKLLNLKELRKNKGMLPFYLLLGFFFLIVAMMFARIFAPRTAAPEVVKPTPTNKALDPLTARVYELREDLKLHDPTKQSLPFPQVDLEFNIN